MLCKFEESSNKESKEFWLRTKNELKFQNTSTLQSNINSEQSLNEDPCIMDYSTRKGENLQTKVITLIIQKHLIL